MGFGSTFRSWKPVQRLSCAVKRRNKRFHTSTPKRQIIEGRRRSKSSIPPCPIYGSVCRSREEHGRICTHGANEWEITRRSPSPPFAGPSNWFERQTIRPVEHEGSSPSKASSHYSPTTTPPGPTHGGNLSVNTLRQVRSPAFTPPRHASPVPLRRRRSSLLSTLSLTLRSIVPHHGKRQDSAIPGMDDPTMDNGPGTPPRIPSPILDGPSDNLWNHPYFHQPGTPSPNRSPSRGPQSCDSNSHAGSEDHVVHVPTRGSWVDARRGRDPEPRKRDRQRDRSRGADSWTTAKENRKLRNSVQADTWLAWEEMMEDKSKSQER